MKGNKNQKAKQNTNQPWSFQLNFDNFTLEALSSQGETTVKKAEAAATKPLKDKQPLQPVHLMPWGEEALGF